jgi:hypothetical protein
MATFSLFDVGACNCSSGCPTFPCSLPATNLTITVSGVYVATLVYTAPCASWNALCFPYAGGNYQRFTVVASGGFTTYTWHQANTGCTILTSPINCVVTSSGSTPTGMFLVSYTCSPLMITFNNGGAQTFVITL